MIIKYLPLLGLLAGASLPAADWPTFRGADRSDVQRESSLLKTWPDAGPKKLWTYENAGLGYAGFSVVKDVVYTLGANEDAEEYVVAVDATSGKEKWTAVVGGRLSNNWGDGPRSTPTVDGDRLYALGGKGDLVCLQLSDGKELWRVNLADFGGKVPSWGYCESVYVEGDHVYCTPGGNEGTLLALNKTTGEKVWQSADWTDPAQYASMVAADLNGKRQLIQLTMQSVAGVDAKTGELLWKQAFPGRTAVIPTPVYRDGHVYVTAGYKVGCMLVKISAENEPKVVYENTNMVNHHGGVVLVGDHLYGFSDGAGWTCQDFKTGEVRWVDKTLGKGAIHAADGMLYLLEEGTGTVVLLEASPEAYRERGRMVLNPQSDQRSARGKVWTHPVVSHGRLFLRDQEFVSSFQVRDGALSASTTR